MKKLIGSLTSPYVRRIRLMLADEKYEFIIAKVFEEEGQKIIAKYTTTGRIPILVDDDTVIWDSLLIAEHLAGGLDLEVKKELVLINEMTDSGVQLFQFHMFDVDKEDKNQFSKNNLRRIGQVFDYFEKKNNNTWDVVGQWLYCTLDWINLREVYDWQPSHPNLTKFLNENKDRDIIKETDPRKV